jgi:hypothetical protein
VAEDTADQVPFAVQALFNNNLIATLHLRMTSNTTMATGNCVGVEILSAVGKLGIRVNGDERGVILAAAYGIIMEADEFAI